MPSRGSKQRNMKEKMAALRAIRTKKEQFKKSEILKNETVKKNISFEIPNVNLKIVTEPDNTDEIAKSTTCKSVSKSNSIKMRINGLENKMTNKLKKRALKGKLTVLRQKATSQNEIKPICLDGFGILEKAPASAKIKMKTPSQPSRRKDNFSDLDDDFYSNFVKNPIETNKISIKELSNNSKSKSLENNLKIKKIPQKPVKIKAKMQIHLKKKDKDHSNNLNENVQTNIAKSTISQILTTQNVPKTGPTVSSVPTSKNDFSDTVMPSLEPEINIASSNNEEHEPSTSDITNPKVLPLIFQRKKPPVIIEPLKAPGENFEIFEARVYLKQLEDELNDLKDRHEKLNQQYEVLSQQKESFKSALENCARVNECLRNEVKKLKIPLKRNSAHSLSLSRRALYNRFSEIDKIISSPEIEFDTIKTAKKCIERISKRLN